MKYVEWLWHNSRGIRWNTAVRIVAGIGQVALGLLMVWLSKLFIDETIREGSADDVLRMVCWLVLTVVGGVILRQVGYWLTTSASVRQTNTLRLRIFSNLFRRQLYNGQEIHSGDVTSRLAKDIEQISDVTTDTLPHMAITMIQLSGAFLLMRWFDEWLAWALLLLTPFAIVFGKLVSRRLRQMTLDIRQSESRIQMQVQEGMEHNAVLRSLGAEQWVTDRLDSMQQRLRGNVMRRMRFTIITRLIMGLVFGLGYLLAFVWGGIGLRNGTITFGVMTSFLQLVGKIQGPVLQLLNMVPGIIHATASIDRLLSQRGEFGFWETYLSKDIANVIMEGIKKIKDGDRLISLLNLVSNDYCILGYVQEKDTAEVNRLLQSPEIRQQLGPDVRLYWGYQEERVSRGLFSNDETNMEDSESAFYGLFCVRGQSPVITGDKIIDAKDEMDSFNHSPIVTMKMNEEGARLFTDMTKKNIGLPIALVMDGRVYSGPRVNMEITGGNASISGQYTPEQTKELALILKSGILKGSAKVIVDKK